MLYIAISIVLYAVIDNAAYWYNAFKYRDNSNISKAIESGHLEWEDHSYDVIQTR